MVIEKKAVAGMRFMPGEMLYQIADISAVWVLADVFERDIGTVKVGAGGTAATVRIDWKILHSAYMTTRMRKGLTRIIA